MASFFIAKKEVMKVLLTRTNWLVTLRDNILERQTLYPDGGNVGRLTKTNWLIKLRDDILARQTLYPFSDDIGLLTATNWLRKLRHEILTNQSLYPIGMAALDGAIKRAQSLLTSTVVSIDGTDIPQNQFWTTQLVRDTFSNAISTAESVLSLATDDEDPAIDPAINSLNDAINTFNFERKPGLLI
jgi:hypothetical protein